MSGFAGRLRERVTVLRAATTRDAIGAATGDWEEIGTMWAAVSPAGSGPVEAGGARAAMPVWRVELRAGDLAVGDRIGWRGRVLTVRGLTRDPATPDRMMAIGEELR